MQSKTQEMKNMLIRTADGSGSPSRSTIRKNKLQSTGAISRPMLGIRVVPSATSDANMFNFGDVYLNDLSDLRQFEIINLLPSAIRVEMRADIQKPFQSSTWGFQTSNENLQELEVEEPRGGNNNGGGTLSRSSSKMSFISDSGGSVMDEGYNELFNQINLIESIVLQPHQVQKLVFSVCVKFDLEAAIQSTHSKNFQSSRMDDSSDDERLFLNESSCIPLLGKLVFATTELSEVQNHVRKYANLDSILIPVQGTVCRSLMRLDIKELHFDDCIPGGSYVKDFTVWNRSEIPLWFRLMSSFSKANSDNQVLTCSDYNTGYTLGESTFHVAAYSHMRIRVTFRPLEVGEQYFEVHVQNLHDARNVKTLKVHTVASKEHFREGLIIREPNGSHLMSGSTLDFGDCYTGVATSKILQIKNTTEAPLHIELTSERNKEITFELKLISNRSRRSTRNNDDTLSPNEAGETILRRLSLSPSSNGGSPPKRIESTSNVALDSDEELEDNEGEYFEDEVSTHRKRGSFEENLMSEMEDNDDDFEFDSESVHHNSIISKQSPPKHDMNSLSPSAHTNPSLPSTTDTRTRTHRSKKKLRIQSRMKDISYESGVDSGNSVCSSPERSKSNHSISSGSKTRSLLPADDALGSNYLVEALDLPPGVERTVLVWYCPLGNAAPSDPSSESSDALDLKSCRLVKQSFRISFRCYQIQGSWQPVQNRIYDRTLGKSIQIRSRTCTSIVTITPSNVHLGDCNIGEFKSSTCVLTNQSELPTIVKSFVTSKVISTVPNDEIVLGPKQSTELKIEIIPRKMNSNYSRLISIINLKNKHNVMQVCVRSSNMDAHHVIYHSLYYKLVTLSKSAFLNFEHVAANSISMRMFSIENITIGLLRLRVQSSDISRIQLFYITPENSHDKTTGHVHAASKQTNNNGTSNKDKEAMENHRFTAMPPLFDKHSVQLTSAGSHTSMVTVSDIPTSITSPSYVTNPNMAVNNTNAANLMPRMNTRPIKRRRSFGCLLEFQKQPNATNKLQHSILRLREYFQFPKKAAIPTLTPIIATTTTTTTTATATNSNINPNNTNAVLQCTTSQVSGNNDPATSSVSGANSVMQKRLNVTVHGKPYNHFESSPIGNIADPVVLSEVVSLTKLFENSKSVSDSGNEQEIVTMLRERMRRYNALVQDQKLIPLATNKEWNVRIPKKSVQSIVVVFTPKIGDISTQEFNKARVEKYKIFITLPAGGNKNITQHDTLARSANQSSAFSAAKHPFDSRPSVRELLMKSRVCQSIMHVNQKNINFGRITTASKSSKTLIIRNMSAISLIFAIEKTGSISSGFLEIKEGGDYGMIKSFSSRQVCFEFQPTLAGPFEEKLKIVNVQDVENSVYVTIKAKVVKRETFKLPQSGQTIAIGTCLAGEKSDEFKVTIRNMSRKKREYVIEVDPTQFSYSSILRPAFTFKLDDTPATNISQAQEKKLDEELEKLEHKLRIAITKKKTDKISKLNSKIKHVKALLSGEEDSVTATLTSTPTTIAASTSLPSKLNEYTGSLSAPTLSDMKANSMAYDSGNSESESESEFHARDNLRQKRFIKTKRSNSSSNSLLNIFHFSLEPESTGRIIGHVVFHSNAIHHNSSTPPHYKTNTPLNKYAASFKKGFKHHSSNNTSASSPGANNNGAPIFGSGKLLFYEQQNKDVMKELNYSVDIYQRTTSGESAYCRSVGKSLLLPPFSQQSTSNNSSKKLHNPIVAIHNDSSSTGNMIQTTASPVITSATINATTTMTTSSSHAATVTALANPKHKESLTQSKRPFDLKFCSNQFGNSHISNFYVPFEVSPMDCNGWVVEIQQNYNATGTSLKTPLQIYVQYESKMEYQELLTLSCSITYQPSNSSKSNGNKSDVDAVDDAISAKSVATNFGTNCVIGTTANSKYVDTTESIIEMVPFAMQVPMDTIASLKFKWKFSNNAGYAQSTPLSACLNHSKFNINSTLDASCKLLELKAGQLQFQYVCQKDTSIQSSSSTSATNHATIDVIITKAKKRSLQVKNSDIDLGEQSLNSTVSKEFYIHNISNQSIKYLILTSTMKQDSSSSNAISQSQYITTNIGTPSLPGTNTTSSNSTPCNSAGSIHSAGSQLPSSSGISSSHSLPVIASFNGSIANSSTATSGSSTSTSSGNAITNSNTNIISFEHSTGRIEPNSKVKIKFTFKGTMSGKYMEQIMIRNLSDRMDYITLQVAVRITRPVYIRIPELDPHATGQLQVLDIGACYVTPSSLMEENSNLKYSKIRKVSLYSQVEETLYVCASSNLKTQCYVYQDAQLTVDASNIKILGHDHIDLYIALRPRLPADAFKTGASRDIMGGIRIQLFRDLEAVPTVVTVLDQNDINSNNSSASTTSVGTAATTAATTSSNTQASTCVSMIAKASSMVAEFTIKFIGVAGASLCSVSPNVIDFGFETNIGRTQKCQIHKGQFEIINTSKTLPLFYRMYVMSENDKFSDDDDSLHVSLRHEKGEIGPNQSSRIQLKVMAYTNGFFRRRILIENINNSTNINYIELILFVFNDTIQCEVVHPLLRNYNSSSCNSSNSGASKKKKRHKLMVMDLNYLNVFMDSIFQIPMKTNPDNENMLMQRYRIYNTELRMTNSFLNFKNRGDNMSSTKTTTGTTGTSSQAVISHRKRCSRVFWAGWYTIQVRNNSSTSLQIRPVTNLPMVFEWNSTTLTTAATSSTYKNNSELLNAGSCANMMPLSQVRNYVSTDETTTVVNDNSNAMYCGDMYTIPSHSAQNLSFRFASIAFTEYLPIDTIASHKAIPFHGMVALQGFEAVGSCDQMMYEASTLNIVQLKGYFGESRLQLQKKSINCGKIGFSTNWEPFRFELEVKNIAEVETIFTLQHVPKCIQVKQFRQCQECVPLLHEEEENIGTVSDSLKVQALQCEVRYKRLQSSSDLPLTFWTIPPLQIATIQLVLLNTSEYLAPGKHAFDIQVVNYDNPQNTETLQISAHVIEQYIKINVEHNGGVLPNTLEAANTLPSQSIKRTPSNLVAYLPTLTVPPPVDTAPPFYGFLFTIKNVYDEDLEVKVHCEEVEALTSVLEFEVISRTSNTSISTFSLPPNESIGIRVACRVVPAAYLPPELLSTQNDSGTGLFELELGRVDVVLSFNDSNTACKPNADLSENDTVTETNVHHRQQSITIKGQLVPGPTFKVNTSKLSFHATAIDFTELTESNQLFSPVATTSTTAIRQASSIIHKASSMKNKGANELGMYQLQVHDETLQLENCSAQKDLHFKFDSIPIDLGQIYLLKTNNTSKEIYIMQEQVHLIAIPSSGVLKPLERIDVQVKLEEIAINKLATQVEDEFYLRNLRHHPNWRSNSWGSADVLLDNSMLMSTTNKGIENAYPLLHKIPLFVRDIENPLYNINIEINTQLILHNDTNPQSSSNSAIINSIANTRGTGTTTEYMKLDRTSVEQALLERGRRVSILKPSNETHLHHHHNRSSFMMTTEKQDQLATGIQIAIPADNIPNVEYTASGENGLVHNGNSLASLSILGIRGCTPAENSTLDNTLYAIDVGQHTVRNGGVVEWEITIENLTPLLHANSAALVSGSNNIGSGSSSSIEYRIHITDSNATSWLQLNRTYGSIETNGYQSITLYFLRDTVGMYSTFVILENLSNPVDMKLIRVKLEVIADLNALRQMSGTIGNDNLFRVLVSCYGTSKRQKHTVADDAFHHEVIGSEPLLDHATHNTSGNMASGLNSRLEIDYGDVFYDKLYHNHSIVLENFSSLSLDFMLSSNARPHEITFSLSSTSFNEISMVTLHAHARLQVFLNFRPVAPNKFGTINGISSHTSDSHSSAIDRRDIEIYVNCRLVKDFRETVFLKAVCNAPQMRVQIALNKPEQSNPSTYIEPALPYFPVQPTLLGIGFTAPESILAAADTSYAMEYSDIRRYLVMKNYTLDANGHIALRNDSMYFDVNVDHILTDDGELCNNISQLVEVIGNNNLSGSRSCTLTVKLEPLYTAIFSIQPNFELLRKHRQQWEHCVKEHIAFYNMMQFAEHYHVSLSFTPSTTSSYYILPQIREAYPFSTLEDTIAKFLKNYNCFWKWLTKSLNESIQNEVNVTSSLATTTTTATNASNTATKTTTTTIAAGTSSVWDRLERMLSNFEQSIDSYTFPTSPRFRSFLNMDPTNDLDQLIQSYRALYFDFYYITDELVWFGVRSNVGRHTFTLADLVYGAVFKHEIFQSTMFENGNSKKTDSKLLRSSIFKSLKRLLLPWTRQLGFFLSFFPENQEATLQLRQIYEQLQQSTLINYGI